MVPARCRGRMGAAVAVLLAVLLAGWGLWVSAARAGSTSTGLQVSASVLASCSVTGGELNFGDYTGRNVHATAMISARCTRHVEYHVTLDAGSHYDGTWRAVANGTHHIPYALYAPGNHEWGDHDYANTYPWGRSHEATGTGHWHPVPVRGVLFGGVTNIPTGPYQDVVTVTIYF